MLCLFKKRAVHTPQANQPQHLPRTWGKEAVLVVLCEKDRLVSGEKKRTERSSGNRDGGEDLTRGGYKSQVLQHHIMVQVSLSLIKELPLLPGEEHGHIFKGHTALS